MSVGATDRLSRLLAMVPWLVARPGVPLADAARQFGIDTDQLVADLELLFVCGTPGHMPDDLIEAEWESGAVYVGNAEQISRPLRLAVDEALALLVGLRALADVPGMHDRDAVEGAITKITAAAGEQAAAAASVDVVLGSGEPAVLNAAREALRRRRRLHLRYLVPSRDETTERDVDPMRILAVDGRWYLEGWCHRADDVRMFRVDRIEEAAVLDVDGTPPAHATSRDVDAGLFTPGPNDTVIVLDLGPRARWVADQYPVETATETGDGRLRVALRTPDPSWVPRLVLRLAGAAVVVSPDDVRARVGELAQAARRAYADTP